MMNKQLLSLGATLFLLGALFNCAEGNVDFDDPEPTSNVSTAATGGSAGAGTGGSEGGATPSPCAIDCRTIDTPPCQVAECNEETKQCEVVNDVDGTACDDGVFCTVDDACMAGLCTGGPPNDCGLVADPCQEITCDETAKTCGTTPAANGSACQPTDLCMLGATCTNGQCLGTPNDCFFAPVPNDCHVAVCNPMNGMCEPQPGNEGEACVDSSDLCTVGKTCSAGQCVGGSAKDCSAFSVGCFNGVCDTTNGQCFGMPIMPGQNCAEATDDCNQGVCDVNGTCLPQPINQGMSCDDGLSCTSGTTCQNGVCGGGTSSVTIYFSEDFASNAAGWTLDTEWEIAPAQVSSGEVYGNPDPGTDHTATNQNNGVAGVVVGGNASTNSTHPFYYLTSPPVNVATAPSVYFEFYRWLNSDYTPYMQNVVEVFDGTSWVQLWASGGSPGVQDNAWTPQSFDLTAYKNSQLRVRFGFNIGSGGVFTVSQWNVDDVLIASGPCL